MKTSRRAGDREHLEKKMSRKTRKKWTGEDKEKSTGENGLGEKNNRR
jgi:hypothetical protein